jgi:hypothetical protein
MDRVAESIFYIDTGWLTGAPEWKQIGYGFSLKTFMPMRRIRESEGGI